MELSKDNIVSKSFSKKVFGGLDEFEVRDFLHVLAEEIRHLTQKNIMLKKQIGEQDSLIRDYRDREHILKESIAGAEKWAEKIRRDAESHSQLVLEKAQSKSESLIQSARHSLQTVYNDIADLKRLQLQFKTGLKAALQVQMDLLEQDSIFNPSLTGGDAEAFLEKKNSIQKEPEKVEQVSSAVKPSSADPSDSSKEPPHSASSSAEVPKTPRINDQELSSLRESLSSLNKSFS